MVSGPEPAKTVAVDPDAVTVAAPAMPATLLVPPISRVLVPDAPTSVSPEAVAEIVSLPALPTSKAPPTELSLSIASAVPPKEYRLISAW